MEHIPYGYRIENGKAVVDETAAWRVRQLFENYISGDSLKKAAENACVTGNHGTINLMLQNRRYTGDNFYPPIISEEMFNAAAEELRNRAERLGRNGHVRKERSVNIPVRFTFISAADYFENPVWQAEYMYGLIKTEVKNIE